MFKKNPLLEHDPAERVKVDFANKGLSTNEQCLEMLEDKLFWLIESVHQIERDTEVVAGVNHY